MSNQYQKYLRNTSQKPPETTGKKYFTVPKEYKEVKEESDEQKR